MARPISARTLTLLAFLAFISLGLPDTLLGVAWPSIRSAFSRVNGDLGFILAGGALGYLLSSFLGGEIVRRFGVGRLLVGSTVLVTIALAGNASTPFFFGLVLFSLLGGLGAGAIDAGINTFAASRFSPRVVNWLHACWGIGASISPLLMTAIIASGRSWRIGYVIIACVMAVMFVLFFRTREMWRIDDDHEKAGVEPVATASIGAAIREPVVIAQMLFYFVYGGLEAGAGAWLFTLLTEGRGMPKALAGTIVGSYWASLTIGRIVFGQIATRLSHLAVIRIGLIGAILSVAMIWAPIGAMANLAGITLLGFTLAPIFPTLISDTPTRVGKFYAPQAVGFQVSGAAVGIAAIPGTIGVLAQQMGIAVLPACLFVAAIALLMLHEAALILSTRNAAKEMPVRASANLGG